MCPVIDRAHREIEPIHFEAHLDVVLVNSAVTELDSFAQARRRIRAPSPFEEATRIAGTVEK